MRYTSLGRTGLTVSVVGLGCGGPSRLGQSYGASRQSAVDVILRALELGVNFFDTAEAYDTESVLGEALAQASRDDVVVSTKKGVWDWQRKRLCSADEMSQGIEASLRRLQRERIDVFHLHGLSSEHVEYALSEIVPVLKRAQGKVRFLAVSEPFNDDRSHVMLERALQLGLFDVVMVGFNLLNPSARHKVFPLTRAGSVGTLVMFAVRRALSNPARLKEVLSELTAQGRLEQNAVDLEAPLAFLGDVRDAAYRFCVHEPGVDVVLTGTGSVEHLEQNVASLLSPPLPADSLARLEGLFGHLDCVTAQ